jgi:phosphoglucomutase
MFEGGSRIVYRLLGTGTVGGRRFASISSITSRRRASSIRRRQAALPDLIALSRTLVGIEARTGRKAPTVIT